MFWRFFPIQYLEVSYIFIGKLQNLRLFSISVFVKIFFIKILFRFTFWECLIIASCNANKKKQLLIVYFKDQFSAAYPYFFWKILNSIFLRCLFLVQHLRKMSFFYKNKRALGWKTASSAKWIDYLKSLFRCPRSSFKFTRYGVIYSKSHCEKQKFWRS